LEKKAFQPEGNGGRKEGKEPPEAYQYKWDQFDQC
jgi:hypothetical protein